MSRNRDEMREEEMSKIEEGLANASTPKPMNGSCTSPVVVTMLQKVIAELVGTYFVIFAGCGAVVVNQIYKNDDGGSPVGGGVAVTWGLIVLVMIYSLSHISGAHFNPAVTITLAILRRFPYSQVPLYIIVQVLGSFLASGTLLLMFDITRDAYFGTVPAGSHAQSLLLEIIITFLLMFVISGLADTRARGELAGIAVGMTIMLNVFMAGPVSGASMNPARSIGPALVKHVYDGLWVYIVGPIIGAIAGGLTYNLLTISLSTPST